MMTRAAAEAYGKRIGCKYYLYNEHGGLLGGYKTREAAEAGKKRFEKEYETDPWNKNEKVHIVEK